MKRQVGSCCNGLHGNRLLRKRCEECGQLISHINSAKCCVAEEGHDSHTTQEAGQELSLIHI